LQINLLQIVDFRNYVHVELPLDGGLYVLEGSNAQGKTSLLEAICSLSTGRSFRTSNDRELIRWDTSRAQVRAQLLRRSGRQRQLDLSWSLEANRIDKQAQLQGHPVKKLAELLGELPLSLFTPQDLSLAQGAPSERRRYLDLILCKLYPSYLESLVRYQQVIKNRVAVLRKEAQPREADLAPWDSLLVLHGSDVTRRREELCVELEREVGRLHPQLAGPGRSLSIVYQPSASSDPQAFQRLLEQHRAGELRQRACQVGPHRDDLELLLGGRSLRRFGSRGQCRSVALTLRLAQARLLDQIGGEPAVILLDDCFSELDPDRQQRLLEVVLEAPQVFVTTAGPLSLNVPCHQLRVVEGQISC
jgi:DNA replication and repair protein RecF